MARARLEEEEKWMVLWLDDRCLYGPFHKMDRDGIRVTNFVFYIDHCAQMAKGRASVAAKPAIKVPRTKAAVSDGDLFGDVGPVFCIIALGCAIAGMLACVRWCAPSYDPGNVAWSPVHVRDERMPPTEYPPEAVVHVDEVPVDDVPYDTVPDPEITPVYNELAVPVGIEGGLLMAHPLENQQINDSVYAPAP